jgi:formylglycine-generating enzyme required for sulfatase activity
MHAAARYRLKQASIGLALLLFFWTIFNFNRDKEHANLLLELAYSAKDRELPEIITRLKPFRALVIGQLEDVERRNTLPGEVDPYYAQQRHRYEQTILLLHHLAPKPLWAAFLRRFLRDADPDRTDLIRHSLATHPPHAGLDDLWRIALSDKSQLEYRLRVAAALAHLDPDGPGWSKVVPALPRALVQEDRGTIPAWVEQFEPVLALLRPALEEFARSPSLDSNTRVSGAVALAEALIRLNDDSAFAGPIADAWPESFRVLIRALERRGATAGTIQDLESILHRSDRSTGLESRLVTTARAKANAALALMALGIPHWVWDRLRSHEDPTIRSILIDRIGRLAVSLQPLLKRLNDPELQDAAEIQAILMALAEVRERKAVGRERLTPGEEDEMLILANKLCQEHGDGGVHSAAELVLRRWGQSGIASQPEKARPAGIKPAQGRDWSLGPNGHAFVAVGPLQGWVGSDPWEESRQDNEKRHFCGTGRRIAVAITEVTAAQYRVFLRDCGLPLEPSLDKADFGMPAGEISWYRAAQYCNWLSRKAGIKGPLCYPERIGSGMTLDAKALDRVAYRLPTEAEWEILCRSGTTTPWPFGKSDDLLPRYAWTWLNSQDKRHRVAELLPNRLGLFDMIGSQWEWCHDVYAETDESKDSPRTYPVGDPDRPARDLAPGIKVEDKDDPGVTQQVRAIMRGGSFDYSPGWARSACRYHGRVQKGIGELYKGFRIVRTLESKNPG